MSTKLTLARGESRGNLIDPKLKQTYLIQFYNPVIENGVPILCEKGIIELVTPSSDGEAVVKSYRMVDPAQERLMIIDLIKLLLYHKAFKGELNTFTLGAEAIRIQKECMRIGNEILKSYNEPNIDWVKRLN